MQKALAAMKREAQGGISMSLAREVLKGPLSDAHDHDSSPIEFDHFDTSPGVGAGILASTVGGPDLTLFASCSTNSEAGRVVVDNRDQWVTSGAGVGGTVGWGLVSLDWALSPPGAGFSSAYNATPNPGYGTVKNLDITFRGKNYQPMRGLTIEGGGQITVRLVLRPIGPVPGAPVVFFGADLLAISSQACNLKSKMQVFKPNNFGPIQPKGLFGSGDGQGRKATISRLFGRGKLADVLNGVSAIVGGRSDAPRNIPE